MIDIYDRFSNNIQVAERDYIIVTQKTVLNLRFWGFSVHFIELRQK